MLKMILIILLISTDKQLTLTNFILSKNSCKMILDIQNWHTIDHIIYNQLIIVYEFIKTCEQINPPTPFEWRSPKQCQSYDDPQSSVDQQLRDPCRWTQSSLHIQQQVWQPVCRQPNLTRLLRVWWRCPISHPQNPSIKYYIIYPVNDAVYQLWVKHRNISQSNPFQRVRDLITSMNIFIVVALIISFLYLNNIGYSID